MLPGDLASTLVILAAFALTFLVSRAVSRYVRGKRSKREDAEQRAGESRQVRRARERRDRQ